MNPAAGGRNRSLTAVPGVAVGHAEDAEARTGCTVVLGPFRGAVEIGGLATGTRELDALSPLHSVPRCDAVLLTGGSAFGLAAADGVMGWLEERDRGFDTAHARVPIVPAAVLYDLGVGDGSVRPGPEMGRSAAEAAGPGPVPEGRVGAGAGATVGKLRGPARAETSGVGSWSRPGERWTVGALAVVNAFGDVTDAENRIVAGTRGDDGEHLGTERAIRDGATVPGFGPGDTPDRQNTTLAVVATDAPLGANALQIMARQAMHALVRRIRPAATPFDGDLVFAVSPVISGGGEAAPGDEVTDRATILSLSLRAEEALEVAIGRSVGTGAAPGGSRSVPGSGEGR